MDIPAIIAAAKEYGPWAIACGLLAWAYWKSRGDLAKCWSERVVDAKSLVEVGREMIAALRAETATNESKNRVMEQMGRALELQGAEMTRTREEIVGLRAEVQRLRGGGQ